MQIFCPSISQQVVVASEKKETKSQAKPAPKSLRASRAALIRSLSLALSIPKCLRKSLSTARRRLPTISTAANFRTLPSDKSWTLSAKPVHHFLLSHRVDLLSDG